MDPIRIDDPADPRVAPYMDIRERDLAGRQGRFVAEGKVVLNVLFSARRFEAESVLLLENRLAGMTETLKSAPAEVPVYVASGDVLDGIAGFHMHRGVLAIGRKRPPETIETLLEALPERALVVVLVGIANHDNIGAIFRNAAAFGADAILLDETCCDPLYRKAIRVSVGAALKVPFAVASETGSLVDTLGKHGFEQIALSPQGTVDCRDMERPQRLALWFGTEGEGLPEALMRRLKTVKIAMAGGFDSLNVAAASAITLHHFTDHRV
ncbi:RNA methyltransferase [Mesorhizobium sp. YR577]|uniref:TrmH family RNA methyltransferase n=1 Tax=Mesorhizobium sp. YR577 TaxID=1884373 RepID=UPI0008F31D17|nr:RNA methyltransferase [Mesorhizobium sp. YR577]SFU22167.1 tRNA G18 (ribose-2'-O)-methylase SpoU [Mesorhizobium sp. YR577]